MRRVTIRSISNTTTPDGSSFGMFTIFKPINLGGNVVYTQKMLMCPKCGRQIPFVENAAKAARKENGKMGTFWKVVIILAVIAVLLVAAAVVLYKTGHMPQRIVDFVKSILPGKVENFVRDLLA